MLTRETHCSKDNNMNQETNVKSDIKYHKRHSGHIQFQGLAQDSGSTEETSPRKSKSRKYFVCILSEKPEMKNISGEQISGIPKAGSISFVNFLLT